MSLSWTIAIRVDASPNIGSGHLLRCYTLAKALAEQGHQLIFVCRTLPLYFRQLLKDHGFSVLLLPPEFSLLAQGLEESRIDPLDKLQLEDALLTLKVLQSLQPLLDWMIVDHYQLDARWEKEIHNYARHLLVIDDLADRPHNCDLMLDQNPYPQLESRYDRLIPPNCCRLLGPAYLMLRSEFTHTQRPSITPQTTASRIMITMGGSDPKNISSWVLRSLSTLQTSHPLQICVILGADFAHGSEVEEIVQSQKYHQIKVESAVTNMSAWMRESDLAISAGGSTTYELAYLGIPALVITASPTQVEIAKEMDHRGVNRYLGSFETLSTEEFLTALAQMIPDQHLRRRMSQRGQDLIDGQGVQRVLQAMGKITLRGQENA